MALERAVGPGDSMLAAGVPGAGASAGPSQRPAAMTVRQAKVALGRAASAVAAKPVPEAMPSSLARVAEAPRAWTAVVPAA